MEYSTLTVVVEGLTGTIPQAVRHEHANDRARRREEGGKRELPLDCHQQADGQEDDHADDRVEKANPAAEVLHDQPRQAL